MTDNEIIKAWECCSAPICNCKECPLEGVVSCYVTLKHKALDLINRLQKENDDLFYKLQGVMWSVDKWLDGKELEQDEVNRAITMREKTLQIVEKQQAEIERLSKTVVDLNANLSESIHCFTRMETLYKIKCKELDVAKTEARKEFAEIIIREYPETDYFVSNLLKEMEGE